MNSPSRLSELLPTRASNRQFLVDHYHFIILALALVVFLALNPVGFIGGGQDDARYLTAARCWVSHGICLPYNHWAGRWPVFSPIAAAIAVFGETRSSVQAWPLISSVIASILLVDISRRLFGKTVAAVIAICFVSIPAFSLQLMTPNVESVEIAFILGAVFCTLNWQIKQSPFWAFAAGLGFGLSIQVRETALIAAGITLIAVLCFRPRPRLVDWAWAAAGFCLPLVIEFLTFQQMTGDFLYRRHLSLNHARIASSELPPTIDVSKSPLFNREIIGGWNRQPGIHIHWLVDGPLNLLFNAKAGFSLLLAPLLLFVGRGALEPWVQRKAWLLLGMSAAYVAAITYVFAMDPKPRVMLTALVASSMSLALIATELWQSGRKLLVGATLGAAIVGCGVVVLGYIRPNWAYQQASAWATEHHDAIETDSMTAMMLTLSPELRRLPGLNSNRPYFMVIGTANCPKWRAKAGLPVASLSVAAEQRLTLFPPLGDSGAWICLFKYQRPIEPEEMSLAVRKVWLSSDHIGP